MYISSPVSLCSLNTLNCVKALSQLEYKTRQELHCPVLQVESAHSKNRVMR